jgi:hypothetical protein
MRRHFAYLTLSLLLPATTSGQNQSAGRVFTTLDEAEASSVEEFRIKFGGSLSIKVRKGPMPGTQPASVARNLDRVAALSGGIARPGELRCSPQCPREVFTQLPAGETLAILFPRVQKDDSTVVVSMEFFSNANGRTRNEGRLSVGLVQRGGKWVSLGGLLRLHGAAPPG